MFILHIRIREYVLESPGFRTLFSAIFPILSGILSGTFVFELSGPAGLIWSNFYKTRSFYALIALIVGIYWYNRALYFYEREARRFLDADYCLAYMRSKCLPEAANRYRALIRTGEGGELKRAMDEMQKILK